MYCAMGSPCMLHVGIQLVPRAAHKETMNAQLPRLWETQKQEGLGRRIHFHYIYHINSGANDVNVLRRIPRIVPISINLDL